MSPHHVYRCYTADDRLLYIGCTSLPVDERLRLHRSKHQRTRRLEWVEHVARIEADPYTNRSEALAAERDAIQRLQPSGNVVHTDRDCRTRYPDGDQPWKARAKVSNRLTARAQSRALSALKALHPDQYRELYEAAKDELVADGEAAA